MRPPAPSRSNHFLCRNYFKRKIIITPAAVQFLLERYYYTLSLCMYYVRMYHQSRRDETQKVIPPQFPHVEYQVHFNKTLNWSQGFIISLEVSTDIRAFAVYIRGIHSKIPTFPSSKSDGRKISYSEGHAHSNV